MCTYHCQDEEDRGDGSCTVEHNHDVVTCEFNIIRGVRNQNRRQQEANGCPQLQIKGTGRERRRDYLLTQILLLLN